MEIGIETVYRIFSNPSFLKKSACAQLRAQTLLIDAKFT